VVLIDLIVAVFNAIACVNSEIQVPRSGFEEDVKGPSPVVFD
jgi:hypothetical protein